MSDVILRLEDTKKYYPVVKGAFKHVLGQIKAVDGVNLELRRGETLGLVGESGCGKTTLGKCIVGLHQATEGKIWYDMDGELLNVVAMSKEEQFRMKRRIQMVFQDPYSSLNPSKTIFQAFDEPMRVHGIGNKTERMDRIAQLLKAVQLPADYMNRYPHEFSGGQRQRICIARALSVGPNTLVCDEPVSALDVSIQAQILNLMKDLQKERQLSYVFIAHDLSVVEFMSDYVAVMYLGKVVEYAAAEELYRRPSHPYTQALLSAVPVPDIDVKKKQIILQGDVPSPADPPKGCRFHPRCQKCQERCKCEEPAMMLLPGDRRHQVACFFPD